jgi:mannose-6-phosphate isomerase-like protein (cupin superfamily)
MVLLMASILLIAAPAAAQAQKPPARSTVSLQVTDAAGTPLAGVQVRATGPVDREGATDDDGTVRFATMLPGTYRFRLEHEGFVTLEREVAFRAGAAPQIQVTLTPAPEPAPPRAPAPPPGPPQPTGEPRTVSVPDLVEEDFVGRDPSRESIIGCTAAALSRLLQLRDPLEEHGHEDADEMLYFVAGEATHRVAGVEHRARPGTFSVVPRGTPHAITRRGARPVVVISILAGEPCSEEDATAMRPRP